MATEKQVVANRRNAKRSTGPQSEGGRRRASGNSLKHGITAQSVVLKDEDPEEFARLHQSYHETYAPEGPLEEQLVLQLVVSAWRIQRAYRSEAASFPTYSAELVVQFSLGPPQDWHQLESILRYGSAVERSFYRSLETLTRLQESRRPQPGPVLSILPPGIPAVTNAKEGVAAMSAIMDSTRQGYMRLDQAMKLMRFIETYLKILERAEYEQVLRASEELLSLIKNQMPQEPSP